MGASVFRNLVVAVSLGFMGQGAFAWEAPTVTYEIDLAPSGQHGRSLDDLESALNAQFNSFKLQSDGVTERGLSVEDVTFYRDVTNESLQFRASITRQANHISLAMWQEAYPVQTLTELLYRNIVLPEALCGRSWAVRSTLEEAKVEYTVSVTFYRGQTIDFLECELTDHRDYMRSPILAGRRLTFEDRH